MNQSILLRFLPVSWNWLIHRKRRVAGELRQEWCIDNIDLPCLLYRPFIVTVQRINWWRFSAVTRHVLWDNMNHLQNHAIGIDKVSSRQLCLSYICNKIEAFRWYFVKYLKIKISNQSNFQPQSVCSVIAVDIGKCSQNTSCRSWHVLAHSIPSLESWPLVRLVCVSV